MKTFRLIYEVCEFAGVFIVLFLIFNAGMNSFFAEYTPTISNAAAILIPPVVMFLYILVKVIEADKREKAKGKLIENA